MENYQYNCTMSKNTTTPTVERGLEHWENEVEYFQQALDGLKVSYALISDLQAYAKEQVKLLTPEREEITP